MAPQGIQTYQRTSITTADRRRIVVMLYEGAVKNLHIAIDAIEAGDNETRTRRIRKTLDIIQFLSASLDFQKGGDIARNLSSLYDYARDTITTANITGDVKKLRETIDLFNVLLEGWKQIADSPEAATASSAVAITRQAAPSLTLAPAGAPKKAQPPREPLAVGAAQASRVVHAAAAKPYRAESAPRMRAVVG